MQYTDVAYKLQRLSEATSSKIGQDYFNSVVEFLAQTLNVDYAFIGELTESRTAIHTLAVHAHGRQAENITYELTGTPCQDVMGNDSCLFADNVQKRFPEDILLQEMGAESYMGTPLFAASGEPIGIIVVLDSKPIHDRELIQSYFDLVTSRVAAEYDRLAAYKLLESQERKFRDLVTFSSDFIWEIDTNREYTLSSSHSKGLLGYSPEEMLGKTPFEFMSEKEAERVSSLFEEVWNQRKAFKGLENAVINKQGELVYVETSGVPIFDEAGEFKGYRGVDHDVSERKKRELELQLSSTVLQTAAEGVMVTTPTHKIMKVNKAFTEITGYEEEEVIGQGPEMLSSDRLGPDFFNQLYETLAVEGAWSGEVWGKRRSGEIYPKWVSVSSMHSDDGDLIGYVTLFSDITKRKEDAEKIAYQANYDALTGLANRHLMEDRFRRALLRAQRDEKKVALFFIDLDRFKQINDSLGHFIGDKLLKEAGQRLKAQVRRTDTAARLGGDEFAVIVPDVTDLGEIETVVNKIIKSFSEPYLLDAHELYISASIGITLYPEDGSSIRTLLRNADNAMYKAKDNGRNCYQFYTQRMHEIASRRHVLENALRKAIANNEFQLHYQPIVDAQTCMPVGCEALIRWNSKDLGNVSPGEFIPLAEETGLIEELGTWVLHEACRESTLLPEALPEAFFVSLNISSYQFQTGRLISKVQTALAESSASTHKLVFEITERLMLHDDDLVTNQLSELKEMGISFSIDDFGTGYSSLSYLHKYPITTLKIDQSFIQELEVSVKTQALVKAIIAMSESLGLKTVAEGIEDTYQAQFLAEHNCSCIQGFLYGKPMPMSDLIAVLSKSE